MLTSKCDRLEKLMLKIASVGANFYDSFHNLDGKSVEFEFPASSNKLTRELSGKQTDGAKEVLERVDIDIALVVNYLERWNEFLLDRNYKETLDYSKEILISLKEMKSIWDSATEDEKDACLEKARLGGRPSNSSFGSTSSLSSLFKVSLIIMLIVASYYEFIR